jgi:excisionase family DNA binding protein
MSPTAVEPQQGAPKRLLRTPAEAAEILAVKESWLRRQAGRRAIPSTMLGKHLRFSDADLAAIADTGRRPARRPGHGPVRGTSHRTTRGRRTPTTDHDRAATEDSS